MHLYTRTVGLSEITSRSAVDSLLTEIIEKAVNNNSVNYNLELDSGDLFYEAQIYYPMLMIKNSTNEKEVGGISIRGYYNPDTKVFKQNYYFPYIVGNHELFTKEVIIERQSDKEAYMVHCNESRKEIVPIYFLSNIVDYLKKENAKESLYNKYNYLSALSISGKIILPIKQTRSQFMKEIYNEKKRNKLVDLVIKGDTEAKADLAFQDFETLNSAYERLNNEDIYSIVKSSFVPIGLECDKYSIIGNIIDLIKLNNEITGEEVYYMQLECNDNIISLAINSKDLYGVPQIGFRFVGKIWLQGSIDFAID